MKICNKFKENKWMFTLTIIFCLLIGWIILFKMSFSLSALDRIRGINLIPFYYDKETSFHLSEVIMNIFAFIPLGLFLKLLKFDFKTSVLLGFGYSLVLEIMQLILKVGITDVTDLITNTLGVVIGATFYVILSTLFKRTDSLDKVLKIFEKHETLFCILLIILYVVSNSYCIQNFGTTDYRSVIVNTIFSVLLVVLMIVLGQVKYYGIFPIKTPKKYLYFIPLIFIASVNLWNGIHINNTNSEILFYILNMINIGFIEEIIFRGFLFKMMEKDNVKIAMAVSAITFGIGHVVNLLNGAELIPTLMQICCASAIGYVFVIIFYKSKSLFPCILTHMVNNSLDIFSVENDISLYVVPPFVIAVSVGYAMYLNKTIKE